MQEQKCKLRIHIHFNTEGHNCWFEAKYIIFLIWFYAHSAEKISVLGRPSTSLADTPRFSLLCNLASIFSVCTRAIDSCLTWVRLFVISWISESIDSQMLCRRRIWFCNNVLKLDLSSSLASSRDRFSFSVWSFSNNAVASRALTSFSSRRTLSVDVE